MKHESKAVVCMRSIIPFFILLFLVGCTPQEVETVEIVQDNQPLPRNKEVNEPEKIVDDQEVEVESEEDTKADPTPQELPETEEVVQVSPFAPTGEVLAGTTSPYVIFNQADYDKALEEGRTVFLYFFANWCPICKAEQKHTVAAFGELNDPNLVGFRVNYKDSETEDGEEILAKEFGITYQHTKVLLKGGEQQLKDLQSWGKDQYLERLA